MNDASNLGRLVMKDRSNLVLVVEDNPAIREVTSRQLRRLGISCHTACNGKEAIEAAKLCSYSLILMDCHMPECDGFEATRRIRQLERSERRTPIVAVSAGIQSNVKQLCLEAGMDDFVPKPVSIERMREIVSCWLPTATAS